MESSWTLDDDQEQDTPGCFHLCVCGKEHVLAVHFAVLRDTDTYLFRYGFCAASHLHGARVWENFIEIVVLGDICTEILVLYR